MPSKIFTDFITPVDAAWLNDVNQATFVSLPAEITRATAAEAANTTAISAETTRATTAEGANTTAINNEIARATAAEATKVAKTSATGSAVLPIGTTAQRDATPAEGYLRGNSTLSQIEAYIGAAWKAIGDLTQAAANLLYAPIAGNAAQTFSVATATAAAHAITKAQFDAKAVIKTSASAPYTPATAELLQRPHGLGFVPSSAKIILECVVADAGYAVGERCASGLVWNGSLTYALGISVDTVNCIFKAVPGYNLAVINKATGSAATPTANAWRYYFEVTP